MGLSASQGRLLLLTARQSDLEFRAQQISQRRLILSSQLEQIATEYQNALSNRQMIINLSSTTESSGGKTVLQKNLTYNALVSGSRNSAMGASKIGITPSATTSEYQTTSLFRLTNGSEIVVSSAEEIPGFDSETMEIASNGTIVKKDGTGVAISGYVIDAALATNTGEPNYLQDCLRNGKYIIQQGTVGTDPEDTTKSTVIWNEVSWDGLSCITDQTYDADDAEAEAKYTREQTKIQNQDKILELELNNVETQRSAVKTEIDSVNKVIDNNIEKSFNIFS